jgi:hypothetical protein
MMQMLVRIIYSDGVVATVATTPEKLQPDDFEHRVITSDVLTDTCNIHADCVRDTLANTSPGDLYVAAAKENQARRERQQQRAAAAREAKAAELRTGRSYHAVGSKKPK